MCHSVIAWPFISLIYLAYPRLVSWTKKLVRYHSIYDTLYHSASLRKKYDTLEYSKVKCYSGDSVCLQNIYSIGHKKCQQAFLAPLTEEQLAKDVVESFNKSY